MILTRMLRAVFVLMEFQCCSGANMEQEVRKDEKDQDIRVDNLRLLDFKDVSRSQRRWEFCSVVRATRQKSKALQISRKS